MLSIVGESACFGKKSVGSLLSSLDFAEEVAEGFGALDLEAVVVGEAFNGKWLLSFACFVVILFDFDVLLLLDELLPYLYALLL